MKTPHEARGKALRQDVTRKSQATFKLARNRPTVFKMIADSNEDRLPELIPLRHFRMSASPFTFYRGTASIMARDLSILPHTGIPVQAVGDAHLMNFGGFATPERNMVFDLNDFDETLPGPWEWDLKRLTTSFTLAARHLNLSEADVKLITANVAASYKESMAQYAEMHMLDLWYMKFELQDIRNHTTNPKTRRMLDQSLQKAEKNTSQQIFYKITQNVLGLFEITDQPPLVYHPIDVKKQIGGILKFLDEYESTLQDDRALLFKQFKVVDVALKVVGVGSVGTRCYVVLLMNERQDPLFIQVKEARQSVLEPYTAKCKYDHNGRRVVEGQRLIQAASDIFLGWSTGPEGRQFYLRQLRDKKLSPDVEHFDKEVLNGYGHLCGRVLARAHAKAGHPKVISTYMGKSPVFEEAIRDFSLAYADQTEKDYKDFIKAIKAGKLPCSEESN
jgi:uncharacterized protein (DUF2252 family)